MGSSHGSHLHIASKDIQRLQTLYNTRDSRAKQCPNNNLNQGKYGLNLCSYYYMINVLLLYDNI
ncbi:glycerol kinase [Acrasis kona]|uniref:Glycerol kinase n=1 Tax=Acrasis kona TaxID=1008807 RepID=A0AAW2YPP3_9EUKA